MLGKVFGVVMEFLCYGSVLRILFRGVVCSKTFFYNLLSSRISQVLVFCFSFDRVLEFFVLSSSEKLSENKIAIEWGGGQASNSRGLARNYRDFCLKIRRTFCRYKNLLKSDYFENLQKGINKNQFFDLFNHLKIQNFRRIWDFAQIFFSSLYLKFISGRIS